MFQAAENHNQPTIYVEAGAANAELETGNHRRIRYLDGIRGIAILSVTLYRLAKEVDPNSDAVLAWVHRLAPIGERGVDLFFVLSGFLITGILLDAKGRRGYFQNFIARRSLRIFPLYFLTLALGVWVLPRLTGTSIFQLPIENQFYLWSYSSNIKMSWSNQWCFGPFDHFWSLAVEEHFYLLWPAVVLFFDEKRLLKVSFILVALVIAARTLTALLFDAEVAIDVLTLFRADSLCLGAIAVLMVRLFSDRQTLKKWALGVMSVSLPLLIFFVVIGKRLLGLPNTLCPLFFGSAMVYLHCSNPESAELKIAEWAPLRFLGKYSYGMYVFQLPIVTAFTLSSVAVWLPFSPVVQAIIYIVLMFTAILLLAVLSFHLFEIHFLKLKDYFRG